MANSEDVDWLAEILGDSSTSGGPEQEFDADACPIDTSPEFKELCECCRRGDLVNVRKLIERGVNINAMDKWNYQPLALASLCGHIDVVRMLLEAGAISGRDTFQGERALISALTDEIRRLLKAYQYTKKEDPYQPLARHIVSLLSPSSVGTRDINVSVSRKADVSDGTRINFKLHKFLLAARAPTLEKSWEKGKPLVISPTIGAKEFALAVKWLYVGEINTAFDEEALAQTAKELDLTRLGYFMDMTGPTRANVLKNEVSAAQADIREWFEEHVLKAAVEVPLSEADDFKLNNKNYADVILRIDEDGDDIPEVDGKKVREPGVVFFPAHKAMLRSEYFTRMFNSGFVESTAELPIICMDCSRACLEIALLYFYTEDIEIPIEHALDCLYLADMLVAEKLFNACVSQITHVGVDEEVPYDAKQILDAAWQFKERNLELHAANWFAAELDQYLEDEEFADLVKQSADKIKNRQETDTIELIDDIRYYLDRMYNMRMDDFSGLMSESFKETEKPAPLPTLAEEDEEAEETNSTPSVSQSPFNDNDSSDSDTSAEDWFEANEDVYVDGEIDWDKIDISKIDEYDVGAIQTVQYNKLLAGIDRLLGRLALATRRRSAGTGLTGT